MLLAIGAMSVLSGCWKTDLSPLPVGTVPFEPSGVPVTGWVVQEFETSDAAFLCPDGEQASVYAIYPEAPVGTVPMAVILHSGPFDYIIDPPPNDPIGGPAYEEPTRLTHTWSVRKAYNTLGMYDDRDPVEQSVGALAGQLANNGVAMIVPANCWGDWYHNQPGVAENAYATEHYYRNGRGLASLAWEAASEPGAAAAAGMTIPITMDTSRTYLIGLGEGGRGVGELLANGATPDRIAVDSSVDDLNAYYADPTLYASTITGLNRIFPGGASETNAASLATVGNLPPTAYVYSSLDSRIPAGSHNAVLGRLGGRTGDLVQDAAVQRHVLLNTDPVLAASVVTFLLQ